MSAAPGASLSFYVSTGGSELTVTYLRLYEGAQYGLDGQYGEAAAPAFQVPGQYRPVTTATPWAGAGWDQDPQDPADFTLTVPAGWQSGLYAAHVVDDRGYEAYITFVVKPAATQHNAIAVIASTASWNKCNTWGESPPLHAAEQCLCLPE